MYYHQEKEREHGTGKMSSDIAKRLLEDSSLPKVGVVIHTCLTSYLYPHMAKSILDSSIDFITL